MKPEKITITKSILLVLVLAIAMSVAGFFCYSKEGYHEDEYYSYYSTNRTTGLYIDNNTWKPREEIEREFMVVPGEGFRYGLVTQVQSWDVHPPFYYWVLHTMSSLFPGVFSKWIGLSVNLMAFYISLLLLAYLAQLLTKNKIYAAVIVLAYALTPAAQSGVTFIRMYALLNVFVLWVTIVHCRNLQSEKLSLRKFFLPLSICTFLGFMTQYYYFIYLFFMAAFFCIYRLVKRKKILDMIWYGLDMILVFGLCYLVYPAFPGQMFHGQRGAQATASFLDLANTFSRMKFFGGLIHTKIFGGTGYLLLFVLLVAVVSAIKKKDPRRYFGWFTDGRILMLVFTVLGYFFTVSKTGLLLGDSSIRYQMSIGAILILIVIGWMLQAKNISERIYIPALIIVNICILAITGPLFLYEEDESRIMLASEYAKEGTPAVYFYNNALTWCVWDSADELLEYPQIYFADQTESGTIEDDIIENADKLVVYVASFEDPDQSLERIKITNPKLTVSDLFYEDTYCSMYLFQ